MGRRALSVATIVASLVLSWLLPGGAVADNPLDRMGVLLPAAAEPAPDVAFTTTETISGSRSRCGSIPRAGARRRSACEAIRRRC